MDILNELVQILKENYYATWMFSILLVCIIIFRTPLSEFVSRLKSVKIGKGGLAADSVQFAQNGERRTKTADDLLEDFGRHELLIDIENKIKADLKEKNIHVQEDSVTKLLVRSLAGAQILLHFEQVHSVIFGTQIGILKNINEAPNRSISTADMHSLFEEAQKKFPNLHKNEEAFLGYLSGTNLIVLENDAYTLTPTGSEFLVWMIKTGKPDNKPL